MSTPSLHPTRVPAMHTNFLHTVIHKATLNSYKIEAKEIQLDAVFNLVGGKNTFLLAVAGFGKSQIPEIYSNLLVQSGRGVVLVPNLLELLGDNQVHDKELAGLTTINFIKLAFNATEVQKITNGDYNYIYLSPEIFLNRKMWEEVYFSGVFQKRSELVVADENHIIYQWGIFKSNKGCMKYGSLGGHLLLWKDMPILIVLIQESLKLEENNITILSSKNRTLQIMKVPDAACWTCNSWGNLQFMFSNNLANEVYPLVLCIIALGMGQIWLGARHLIHVGCGDPWAIFQMMGQCGWDGCAGLAILFVKKNRVNGKNKLSNFTSGVEQSNDNHMDTLAITPLQILK
ncbi:hypothetical protein VP01_148g18 [Puccinia sorghi]|uniref:DNA 3'-5' helicase n=1 Tax=Puccinia sorghi TaxID=27349 RepID=A0A0L6VJD5_9BASI|nr:hypothetical protein VP01_148g18 [Puccinia sorghi]